MPRPRLIAKEEAPCSPDSTLGLDLVQRAEDLALACLHEPMHISALCGLLSVSERTLRKAFQRVHGLSPCRHLRMLRLSRARGALLSADASLTTVTAIATGFGFLELGRFSVEYRQIFGESPSRTLQIGMSSSSPPLSQLAAASSLAI
jgi:transcriptional regulator GlxA family with amidase domain